MKIGSNLQEPLKVIETARNNAMSERQILQAQIVELMERAAGLEKTIDGYRRAYGLLEVESNKE